MSTSREKRAVAVVGTGQTVNVLKRTDVGFPGLVYEAVSAALDDSRLTMEDIDAVVFGVPAEYFEGVNRPQMWCAAELGAYLRPTFMVSTGGTAGAASTLAAYYHAASGAFDVVMGVSGTKLSAGDTTYILSTVAEPIWTRDFMCGAVGFAAMQCRDYMDRYGITEEQAAKVAVKNRRNAFNNPYAQLKLDITVEDVMKSPVISSPIKLLDCCPTTDGAAAVILASEGSAREICSRPAWIHGVSAVADGINYPGRDMVIPRAMRQAARRAYDMAGIGDPLEELDVAEIYEPFSFQELIWYEALGFCGPGEGGSLIDSGETGMKGELPVNPSGGILCANAGSSAMVRQIEAALQVMGRAGDRQVTGVERALAHGWGAGLQFFTVMILGRDKP